MGGEVRGQPSVSRLDLVVPGRSAYLGDGVTFTNVPRAPGKNTLPP